MNREEIHVLIRELPGTRNVQKDFTNWVTTHCPLAPYTHEKKSDSKPSFGIKIQPDDVSTFHCFTCKRRGSIADLYSMLYDFTGEPAYDKASKDFRHSEEFGFELPEWGVRKKRSRIVLDLSGPPTPMTNARDVMDTYPAVTTHPYLKHRKIGPNTAKKINLRLETGVSRKYDRIIFPVYGLDRKLYGLTGRICMKGEIPDNIVKQKDYFGFEKRKSLLGAHLLHAKTRFIVLVEGPFDYARVLQAVYPAGLPLAVLHSGLTPAQLGILKKIRLPVYLFYDNDAAGEEGTDVALKLISPHVPVLQCVYPNSGTGTAVSLDDSLTEFLAGVQVPVTDSDSEDTESDEDRLLYRLTIGTDFTPQMIKDVGFIVQRTAFGGVELTDSGDGQIFTFRRISDARINLPSIYSLIMQKYGSSVPAPVLRQGGDDGSVGTDPGSLTRSQIQYAIENAILK